MISLAQTQLFDLKSQKHVVQLCCNLLAKVNNNIETARFGKQNMNVAHNICTACPIEKHYVTHTDYLTEWNTQ